MRLIILSEEARGGGNPAYRGTDHPCPDYYEQLPEDHDANTLCLWYTHERYGEHASVQDLDQARTLVRQQKQYRDAAYEIVEIVLPGETPTAGTEFLGYDLSTFHNSVLWYGLELETCDPEAPQYKDFEWDKQWVQFRPLYCLVCAHFAPRLNANGLFAEYETAKFCLECITALKILDPKAFEGGVDYQVLGLYKVLLDAE